MYQHVRASLNMCCQMVRFVRQRKVLRDQMEVLSSHFLSLSNFYLTVLLGGQCQGLFQDGVCPLGERRFFMDGNLDCDCDEVGGIQIYILFI